MVIETFKDKNEKIQKRLKELEERHVETDKEVLSKLSKHLNGLLNRLSTLNIHSISTQIIQLFYSNQYTRYDLINTIEILLKQILLNKQSLIPDRLQAEYAALLSILSSNIGIELGATILTNLVLLFNKQFEETNVFEIENKYIDNLLTFICYLYNFKVFSSVLIFDLINELIVKNFTNKNILFEKLIDLLVIILRKIGFVLRKDNPLQLKEFIINLKSKLNELNSKENEVNSRLKFMLESLVAIKNNDIRKLTDSFYSDDQINCEDIYEMLIKRIKTLYSNNMKYNDVQLNVSLSDLLNSNKRGKWWIVGSAWSNEDNSGKIEENKSEDRKLFKQNKSNFSEKLLELARKQHMNTDIRRTIFCIIMSAEDYTDAYVKLMKLALKKKQEREIVYIIVHCLLHEKTYNPYYSHLMQRFCDFDRRFKVCTCY